MAVIIQGESHQTRGPNMVESADVITAGLDPEQRRAVEMPPGPLLIIAGPGSGKTRVITHRIAALIDMHNVPSEHILAVTFTNAAASELKQRVQNLMPRRQHDYTVMTFHSFGYHLLRNHGHEVGLDSSFSIIDPDDAPMLVRDAIKYHEYDPREVNHREILADISRAKLSLRSPADLQEAVAYETADVDDQMLAEIYATYQRFLANANSIDLDDLIYRSVHALRDFPELARTVRSRYRHILIDEYQDTDHAQMTLATLLAQPRNQITAVGDPDQAIYGWRGADINNILDFTKHFPEAVTITLDRNYRSTPQIVEAAHDVIVNNSEHIDHPLISQQPNGNLPIYHKAANTQHQAELAIVLLKDSLQQDELDWGNAAVLYRNNSQSREVEEQCIEEGIPYRMLSGTPFYQRAEIRNVVAYLRTIDNPADALCFQRIINIPPRDIGPRTMEPVIAASRDSHSTVAQIIAAPHELGQPPQGLTKRQRIAVSRFNQVYQDIFAKAADSTLHDLTEYVIHRTGLEEYTKKQENGQDRWDNIQELLENTRQFGMARPHGLPRFLERVALMDPFNDPEHRQTPDDQDAAPGPGEQDPTPAPRLTLSTLHRAKGTEFHSIAIVGMTEGIIPSSRSENIQEERRLCYVGITRAKQHLFLVHPRSAWGRPGQPSRFIYEIENLVYA